MKGHKSKVWLISDEEFEAIVKKHQHYVDILEELGFKRTSGSMGKVVKARIIHDNIDVSHMSKRHNRGGIKRIPLEDILIKDSKYTNMNVLKRRLVAEGIKEYICTKCFNDGNWQGTSLVLQLDHIDGDHKNNEVENLRFLCPNCHSQTDTYSGKNMGVCK